MKSPTIIFAVLLVIISILYVIEKVRFPVTLIICDTTYSDCGAFKKFEDRLSCELDRERGNWLCDDSDPNNIICKVATDSTAVSYCE